MNSLKSDTKYFPGLDGLRGISCLIVVLTHNFGFSNFFEFGWLGVDLFFVISGFLITNVLLNSLDTENYLKNFYLRRFLRIFPLYYLMLALFIFILPAFKYFDEHLRYYSENQLWFWLYFQNWLFIFNFPTEAKHLTHFWSLAVEEQFYLLWPLIILWLRTPKKLISFILLVLISLFFIRSYVWYLHIEGFNYTVFYRFTRIDGICIGCLLALYYKVNKNFISNNMALLTILLALLNFIFYFLNKQNNFDFPYLAYIGYTTFSAMLGLLVNEIIRGNKSWFFSFFSFPPFRFIGKISYGLYVYHYPIFLLTQKNLVQFFSTNVNISLIQSKYAAAFFATIFAILISLISYHFFEKRLLKIKEKFI
ncbi:MAG TPA: acyltransferase [Chitinophagaceae bacterium]